MTTAKCKYKAWLSEHGREGCSDCGMRNACDYHCGPNTGQERAKQERRNNKTMAENRCITCGQIIPEGRQVCGICERYGDDAETVEMKKLAETLTATQAIKLHAILANKVNKLYFRGVRAPEEMLEAITRQTETMRESASRLQQDAEELERIMRCY